MKPPALVKYAKLGELPGLDAPFEIPLRSAQDIVSKRLGKEFQDGRIAEVGSASLAIMIRRLIVIADVEIKKMLATQATEHLDPKEFREFVRAVAELRALQKAASQGADASAPPHAGGADEEGAPTNGSSSSPVLSAALAQIEKEAGA
jgi:hypothetical protein